VQTEGPGVCSVRVSCGRGVPSPNVYVMRFLKQSSCNEFDGMILARLEALLPVMAYAYPSLPGKVESPPGEEKEEELSIPM
jgi:hypothetical protein